MFRSHTGPFSSIQNCVPHDCLKKLQLDNCVQCYGWLQPILPPITANYWPITLFKRSVAWHMIGWNRPSIVPKCCNILYAIHGSILIQSIILLILWKILCRHVSGPFVIYTVVWQSPCENKSINCSHSTFIALSVSDHTLWSRSFFWGMHADPLTYKSCFLLSQTDTKKSPTLLYQELHSSFTNIPCFFS